MTPLVVSLLVAGALAGFAVARWVGRRTYRLEEERDLPHRRTAWWLVPGLALAWGGLGWRFGVEGVSGALLLALCLAFAVLAAALVAIDLDVHRLPDFLVLPSYPVLVVLLGVLAAVTGDWGAWMRAVLAGAVLLIGYFLLALFSPGGRGLGLGDVKLAGVLGLLLGWLGWGPVVLGVYAGFIIGGLVAVLMLVSGRLGWKGDLAYGPPMLLGALVGLLAPSGWLGAFLLG